jgi:anthranilate synthase component 2
LKLLIVDNYDSFTFNLVQIIDQLGCKDFDVIKNDHLEIPLISDYDKILISPGPGLPIENGKLFDLINAYHKTKSILGVCLGFQAIAEFFGAKLHCFPKPFHGISSKIELLKPKDLLFNGMEDKIFVGRYHSWFVDSVNLPKSVFATAIVDEHVVMALRHKDFDVCGVQFHPESIMTTNGSKIIENWLQS